MPLADRSLKGPPLEAPALERVLSSDLPLLPLLHEALRVREAHFGRRVRVQILNNAQNARCPEDCGYCSQSRISSTPLRPYPWKPRDELIEGARRARAAGAFRYCMVASGRGPSLSQVRELADTVREIKREVPVEICVSVGLVDDEKARLLRDAGVDRLNHNLNTSERRYPEICSTHSYAERIATLEAARRVGLDVCSGLIAGMGEADRDLVEVALELRRLEVPSIPVNFLIPIEGNPVRSDGTLSPERCLRILALFRFANPEAEIRAAAGREGHLGALGALALWPANSLFVEGYLTTRGAHALDTYRMIRDAGFVVEQSDHSIASWTQLGLSEDFDLPGDAPLLKPEVRAELA